MKDNPIPCLINPVPELIRFPGSTKRRTMRFFRFPRLRALWMIFSSTSALVDFDFQLHSRERAPVEARKVAGAEVLGVFGVLHEYLVQVDGVAGWEGDEERFLGLPQGEPAANVRYAVQLRGRSAIQEACDMINAYSLVVVELVVWGEL